MKPIVVWLPEETLNQLDNVVFRGFYPTRAEAIRNAIRDLIKLHGEHEK